MTQKMEQDKGDFAALIMPICGDKTIVVKEPGKPAPLYWKFSGGAKEPGETPIETAIRELREETGIEVSAENLILVTDVERRTHTQYFFLAIVDSFEDRKRHGDEGEIIKVIDIKDIRGLGKEENVLYPGEEPEDKFFPQQVVFLDAFEAYVQSLQPASKAEVEHA